MIAIKNTESPKSCTQCWFSKGAYCIYHDSDWVGDHQANQTKPEWCPIIEIIQCKDCKWYVYSEEAFGHVCYFNSSYRRENDYCSDGERKTGDETN
jgi:hypothetical protein